MFSGVACGAYGYYSKNNYSAMIKGLLMSIPATILGIFTDDQLLQNLGKK